ncbi:MAG TPA: hypothetical protein VNO30_23530 [Kofleriaceae bacterium]|nr:hypothetical protein [Kofleriaceae bacterium]
MRVPVVAVATVVAACGSHRHEPAAHPDDISRLYVEISTDRSHRRSLQGGAAAGLGKIPFVVEVPASRGGDAELQIHVSRLDVVGSETVCSIKILVLRLPQHDLFGMAEGTARAGGTHGQAADDCIARLGESLIGGKVRTLLHKRLDEKR